MNFNARHIKKLLNELRDASENMEDKFDNLSLFYKSGVQQTGWKKYKEINLKYKDQIVCIKR